MKLIKHLYLTDRVFYCLGAVIFLCFTSFLVHPVFYAAVGLLGLCFLVILVDMMILFRKQNIEASRETQPVFSLGDKNKVAIHLRNNTARSLKIKIIDEIPHQFEERDFSMTIPIGKLKNEIVTYHMTPTIRGEYSFGNIQLFIRTHLGFAMKRETTQASRSVVVYPSVIQMKQQELAAMKHPSFTQGDKTNKKRGRSYEFDQIKNYIEGDDTRSINWKATSSQNKLMVNHYEDERSQVVYSIIDKSRAMRMPFKGLTLVDYAINSTLAFSNIVLKKQDKAGLICFSRKVETTVKADRSVTQLKKIMYALYKEKYDYSEASYEALYSSIRQTISNRSLIFLYTSFDSIFALERNMKVLRMINKYHVLIIVFFENTELDEYSRSPATSVLEIYQRTIAKKSNIEKLQIIKELRMIGIHAIKSDPENLSTKTINKYLELKSSGFL
jgi:uncharacterized protein (DUF58 family)